MTTYTVFCCSPDGKGTVWIASLEATSVDAARRKGRKRCAEDWSCSIDDVHVLGVAAGDVNILYWSDTHD